MRIMLWVSCFLLITLPGCDSTSALLDLEEDYPAIRTLENSLTNQDRKFKCVGYSLNKPGEEHKTIYFITAEYFSDDILDRSDGNIAQFAFLFFAEDPSESNWTIGKFENVVRTAICNLPDVKDIEKVVAKRFIDHGPIRWLPDGREPSGYQYFAAQKDPDRK